MKIQNNYIHTLHACNIGYVTQAIVNNFAPLLFLTFRSEFGISIAETSALVMLNFVTQMVVAFLSAKIADRISYRRTLVGGGFCSALGLFLLAFLPRLIPRPFLALSVSIAVYAIGGGVVEAIDSPLVEACPFKRKAADMSLVHAFYCWGQMLVVLCSSLYFRMFHVENWRVLACVWALVPLLNAVYFMFVPMKSLVSDKERALGFSDLFRNRLFWLFAIMMLCSGASEHCMNQWASAFSESALHIDKSLGDILGPCFFAFFMGSSRTLFAVFSKKLNLLNCLVASSLSCACAYLVVGVFSNPWLCLAGCALCGWSAGILWGGVFSMSSCTIPAGGTVMFALLALPGDFGCGFGPMLVGFSTQYVFRDNLRYGIFSGIVFPVVMLLCLLCYKYAYLPRHPEIKLPNA